MPNGKHHRKLETPIWRVWEFVSDMNNWAPLVPGYMDHEIVTDKQSTWKFKGDIGIMQKTIHMRIDITEWEAPSKVSFILTGINENVKGNGYFLAESVDDNQTTMSSNLSIAAKGMMAPMVNKVLKTMIPKMTKSLTENVANKIEETDQFIQRQGETVYSR
ncbi:Carbon monoxide dehydrogenase subunit G [Oceanobacillus limi]|uniref:Carbon monoxide dehydrogenase subunit G n=1 Tax=Oceanobacillus limi TaxID=930131 RepID=A0A1I0FKM8_9BACI|nr:SRPBCC family protein [Oceanobacillus limi]SET58909.1 Carbon monoxide dehydrogenase subunit G [Oceanobacillus limi]